MMKKNIFSLAAIALVAVAGFSSCSNNDDDSKKTDDAAVDAVNLNYWEANTTNWNNYMVNVANLLSEDATTLRDAWVNGYAETFKNPGDGKTYQTSQACINEIMVGCSDIAKEVGTSKIKEPYDKYVSGDIEGGLLAVESWYSFHSRQDYRNNIYSVRNSVYGTLDATVAANSIMQYLKDNHPTEATTLDDAITAAADAIWAIPDPFRNHINSNETVTAMTKCSELQKILDNINTLLANDYLANQVNVDVAFKAIIAQYVDVVVLPTYKNLKTQVDNLNSKVRAFATSPSDAAFEAVCKAWLDARQPWETSEAFLFGPVADKGLDPNMDSWPLDPEALVNILTKADWSSLKWDGEFNEDDEVIGAAQNVRGFHTLEYLSFKDGAPRTIAAK